MSCIRGYKIQFFKKVFQSSIPNVKFSTRQEFLNCSLAILSLREKGAIELCKPVKNQFLSSYFLVPKADGSHRFILNLKKLNNFMEAPHFKLEDVRTLSKLIFPGYFMSTIDLQDAYYLVPIAVESRKYLRFEFDGKLYQFTCLPFGLSISPFLFTKILKPVINYLRSLGYLSVIYLDDICLIGKNAKICRANMIQTKILLESLGFLINESKSNPFPSTRCKFLGLMVDSIKYCIELPDVKRVELVSLIKTFFTKKSCTITEFSILIGKLISACPAAEYGLLYTRTFERVKIAALQASSFNYESKMLIPKTIFEDLNWWLVNLPRTFKSIKSENFKVTIFTDASDSGWGATNGTDRIYGHWDNTQQSFHINFKELLAVKFALEFLGKNLYNCQVLLRIDNTTAISYVNRMGGVRYSKYHKLAKNIWQWAEERKVYLFASYIASAQNTEADLLSRIDNDDTEWELDERNFNKVINVFGMPDIDLFASDQNKKCDIYISWKRDPKAWLIDAFTVSWTDLKFYAFPPFSLVLKTLVKIKNDKALGILIVPDWPGQSWWPLFNELLVSQTLTLGPDDDLLISPCRRKIHRQARHLRLIVGVVSGRPF